MRYRGCKGVLSRNSLLAGRQLQVRRSMEKFTSSHLQLEVCSVASWLPAYLNRQVIIMMDHNGVGPEVSRCPAASRTAAAIVGNSTVLSTSALQGMRKPAACSQAGCRSLDRTQSLLCGMLCSGCASLPCGVRTVAGHPGQAGRPAV